MPREILGYVVSVDIKYRETVPNTRESHQVVEDTGEGTERVRKHGWVKPPEGSVEVVTKDETIYTQTVDALDMAKLVAVVNKL